MKKTNIAFCFLSLSLITGNAFSQTGYLAPVQEKMEQYNKTQFAEKLYVHTDKDFYSSGDLVWFKVYAFEASGNRPSALSRVVYAEILDAENKPVARGKIAMNEKGGHGSFLLPIALSSGNYRFRAYTSAMKNLGAGHFFEKIIAVVNPLKSPDADDEGTGQFDLTLFPEGGNMVQGIQSRVAYRIRDHKGRGLEGKGYLLNQNNDTISIFEPLRFGLGSFLLTPRANQSYKMIFVLPDGKFVSRDLPKTYDQGYVMTVEDVENDRVSVTVHSNMRSGYPEIFLLAQTGNDTRSVKRAVISDGMASFLVDRAELGEGISRFTIFNNEKQPVCERLYFKQPQQTTVGFRSASASYASREKVSLDISLPSLERSNLSLSVFQTNGLQKNEKDILAYIWLGSELMGEIEEPSYYLNNKSSEVAKAADLLMLTHGWRKFSWEKVLNSEPVLRYPVEHAGHRIVARITDAANNPVRNVQGFLSIPGAKYKLYTASSNEAGLVYFDVKDYYGPGEVILQIDRKKDSTYRIELLSPYSDSFTAHALPVLDLKPDQQNSIENMSIGMQTQHIYLADSIRKFNEPLPADSFSFYGKATNSYQLDDYKRFGTMEEVLREYVREVNVGVKGSGSSLRFKLFNELNRDYYTDNILVLLDGVPFFDPNKVFELDPAKIRSLDVITRNYVLGSSVYYGLASFRSYTENFEGFEPAAGAVTVDYEGLQMHREFYAPDYSEALKRNSRIPDMRTTLYWLPYISSSAISFFTGDQKGEFIAVVQGVDANGKPVSAVTGFEVK